MPYQENGRLVRAHDHETLWIEPWGTNSLRVRVTRRSQDEDAFQPAFVIASMRCAQTGCPACASSCAGSTD